LTLQFKDKATLQQAKKILDENRKVLYDFKRSLLYKQIDKYKLDKMMP